MIGKFLSNDGFTSAIFRDELRRLNSHLPKNRRTLQDLLTDPSPTVVSVSGHTIRMKRAELEDFARVMPADQMDRIRLPFVLLRRRDLGSGAFTVLGDLYEEFAIVSVTEHFSGTFEEFRSQHRSVSTIYKPQISMLLRRFHSLVIIGFG